MSDINKSICPETGEPNNCEVAAGGVIENCWCWEMPHVAPVPSDPDAACLSRDALAEKIAG